jgi:hypothetical protein
MKTAWYWICTLPVCTSLEETEKHPVLQWFKWLRLHGSNVRPID